MPYVKTISEDGVVSDIMAKALDPTLDATVLHKSELVNGFTQTTPGVNALDAAAGKSLNDSLSNCATKTDLTNITPSVVVNESNPSGYTSVPNDTETTLYTTTLAKGLYIATLKVTFRNNNSTGMRKAIIYSPSTANYVQDTAAISGEWVNLSVAAILNCTASRTVSFSVRHTAGAAVSVAWEAKAVRIKDNA